MDEYSLHSAPNARLTRHSVFCRYFGAVRCDGPLLCGGQSGLYPRFGALLTPFLLLPLIICFGLLSFCAVCDQLDECLTLRIVARGEMQAPIHSQPTGSRVPHHHTPKPAGSQALSTDDSHRAGGGNSAPTSATAHTYTMSPARYRAALRSVRQRRGVPQQTFDWDARNASLLAAAGGAGSGSVRAVREDVDAEDEELDEAVENQVVPPSEQPELVPPHPNLFHPENDGSSTPSPTSLAASPASLPHVSSQATAHMPSINRSDRTPPPSAVASRSPPPQSSRPQQLSEHQSLLPSNTSPTTYSATAQSSHARANATSAASSSLRQPLLAPPAARPTPNRPPSN